MEDVDACVEPPGLGDERRDGGVLGVARARGEEVGVPGAAPLRGRVEVVRVLGVHDEQTAEACYLGQGAGESVLVEVRELVDARRGQEGLEAEDPGVVQGPQVLDVVGQGAAPEADVDMRLVGGDLALRPEVVDRRRRREELRGMSTRVVMPPAAAARVAVQKPSQWVRPGSFTWTWVSTRPGSRTWSPRSSRRAPAGTSASYGSTAVILPSATATAAGRDPSGVMTRVERNTSSASDTGTPLAVPPFTSA